VRQAALFLNALLAPRRVLVAGPPADTQSVCDVLPQAAAYASDGSPSAQHDLVLCLEHGDRADTTAAIEQTSRYLAAGDAVSVPADLCSRADLEYVARRSLGAPFPFRIYERVLCPLCGRTMAGPVVRDMLRDGGSAAVAVPIRETPAEVEAGYEEMHHYEFSKAALEDLLHRYGLPPVLWEDGYSASGLRQAQILCRKESGEGAPSRPA
jgi:hypothetical protein